jgi:hypothetical protein
MQTRPVISAVLLVPFIYSAFSIPGVCALPPDPNLEVLIAKQRMSQENIYKHVAGPNNLKTLA